MLRKIEYLETDSRDCPKREVLISDCGVLDEGDEIGIIPNGEDRLIDLYPDYPQDYQGPKTIENLVNIGKIFKDSGNEVFRKMEFSSALEFYDKVAFQTNSRLIMNESMYVCV